METQLLLRASWANVGHLRSRWFSSYLKLSYKRLWETLLKQISDSNFSECKITLFALIYNKLVRGKWTRKMMSPQNVCITFLSLPQRADNLSFLNKMNDVLLATVLTQLFEELFWNLSFVITEFRSHLSLVFIPIIFYTFKMSQNYI